jgi:hypothetical protein
MSDFHHRQLRQMRELWRRHEESQTTLAIVMAGIAALFVAGIAAAFLYAKDTNPTQTAERPALPGASAPSLGAPMTGASRPVPPPMREPETTGSGGGAREDRDINRTPPAQDPRENQQMERN